jgi:hypothetical protein
MIPGNSQANNYRGDNNMLFSIAENQEEEQKEDDEMVGNRITSSPRFKEL